MGKYQRSVVRNKWEKIKGPLSEKNGKSQTSVVKQNLQKINGPRSNKIGKKSKVRGQ